MNVKSWTQKVFQLRRLPIHISNPDEAANLLGVTLGIPADHVIIYSLAKASNIYEPPSKVATLRLKSVPACLEENVTAGQWSIPVSAAALNEDLILDTHFKGMTVLNDVEPVKHHADCIAISGLASHPFGSWQPHGHDKTFMWIRDEIPRSVPGVRTIIYGYGSELVGSRSFQSIKDIAQSLILHLKSGGWNLPSSKPIVFLAHSLGGIVLKEAITLMADREKSIAGNLDNIQGAIMFGVPSLGMQQSHLMAMVERQGNMMLVQDLSRENGTSYLRDLNTRFEGLSFVRTVQILWAYETEESPTTVQRKDGSWDREGPLAVLVNPDSATCDYNRNDKSLTIPINKNHSDMVKFARGDHNLEVIISSLARLCSPTQRASGSPTADVDVTFDIDIQAVPRGPGADMPIIDDGTLRELNQIRAQLRPIASSIRGTVNWLRSPPLGPKYSNKTESDVHDELYFPELDFRVDQIEDPFQDTFKWIFDLQIFTNWLQEGSKLFWINGKPGSGKSTLMKFIFKSKQTWELMHNWRTNSSEIRAGFFFHYRGSAIQKSFEGVLRSLIIQIISPHRTAFCKKYERLRDEIRFLGDSKQYFEGRGPDIEKSLKEIAKEIPKARARLARAAGDDSFQPEEVVSPGNEGIMNLKIKPKTVETLLDDEKNLRKELKGLPDKIAANRESLLSLLEKARPYVTARETKFLKGVAASAAVNSNLKQDFHI